MEDIKRFLDDLMMDFSLFLAMNHDLCGNQMVSMFFSYLKQNTMAAYSLLIVKHFAALVHRFSWYTNAPVFFLFN